MMTIIILLYRPSSSSFEWITVQLKEKQTLPFHSLGDHNQSLYSSAVAQLNLEYKGVHRSQDSLPLLLGRVK